jgi:hypothetical protein
MSEQAEQTLLIAQLIWITLQQASVEGTPGATCDAVTWADLTPAEQAPFLRAATRVLQVLASQKKQGV